MASRRMLNHYVVLYNYVGEINDVATYQATKISPCFCPSQNGTVKSSQGENADNSATIYVFDHASKAESLDGVTRSYISYDEWLNTPDSEKVNYWTLSDRGYDYFQKGNNLANVRQEIADKFKVVKFQRFDSGSKRMWHWEVYGK